MTAPIPYRPAATPAVSGPEDPCAMLAKLEKARDDIIMGNHFAELGYTSGSGSERKGRKFAPDLNRLDQQIRKYQSLCALCKGEPDPFGLIRAG